MPHRTSSEFLRLRSRSAPPVLFALDSLSSQHISATGVHEHFVSGTDDISNQGPARLGVDGERCHRSWTAELCLRDQLRNQRLIELGWEVKRFWVYDVRDSLDECVTTVRRWVEATKGPA